jgi:hypothetical protein
MKFPAKDSHSYLLQKKWLLPTIRQIQKDLSFQNLALTLGSNPSFSELKEQLLILLIDLEANDHQVLKNVLYQVDLDERHIRKSMLMSSDQSFYEVLSLLLIKRCFQKVWTRLHFSNTENRSSDGLLNQ